MRHDLPPWVGQVLDLALRPEPVRRFQTALLFREALGRGLANLPIDTPPAAVVPPELVATAAPSSLPIAPVPPAIEVVKFTPPPAAEVRTVAALPVSPPHQAAATGKRSNIIVMAGVGVIILVALVGGAALLLRPDATNSAPAMPASAPQPLMAAPTAPPAPPSAPAAALPSPGPATNPAGSPALAPPPAGQGTSLVAPAGSSATVPAPVAGPLDPAAPAASGALVAARGARGRVLAAADAPAVFKAVRAFVVNGKNVDEPEAALHFGGGRVRLTDPLGQTTLATLPYADITSASYSRGKNPRWYPTLAGPSANVDMPGGLFRPDRHWLVLQSRAGYLIVRLTDEGFRPVIAMADARLQVKVESLTARGQ